ncbi:SDR family NAD(P)-dependent oxidoreductase [Roseibium sp. M-1]
MTTSKGVVLITGGSSGIGAIYADRFASRGHDLILVARNSEKLSAVANNLKTLYGVDVEKLVADLTEHGDLAVVERRLADDRSITHLVNNAGFGAVAPLAQSDADDMERMIAVNVTAPMRLSRAVVPAFVERGQGTIINISSILAILPEIANGVYGGTKSFLLSFSHKLRSELEGTGVHLQVVLPGATATEFWDVAGLPVSNLPQEWVMSATDLVDAALVGLDRGEYATIPSLSDESQWDAWEAARQAMNSHLSNVNVAPRYTTSSAA